MEKIDITSPSDDITLFTDEEQIVLDSVDFDFEQSNKIRGVYRKITVFNGNHCYQAIQDKHQRKIKYRVDIAFLNPHPFREHNIAWKWLYASIAFASISAALIIVGWFTTLLGPTTPEIYYLLLTVVTVAATLITLLLFAHQTYDKVIFKTQFGNIKVIELMNKYPNKDSFRQFVSKFIVQIKKAKASKNYTTTKFLALELKEIRRLRDETAVSEEEYQSAKSIIFRHSSFKAS